MWRRILSLLLQWLDRYITRDDKMATPFTLGITTDVGALANFVTECIKAGMDVVDFFESPQMVSARQQAEAQKQRDADALAVKQAQGGDLTDLRERSS